MASYKLAWNVVLDPRVWLGSRAGRTVRAVLLTPPPLGSRRVGAALLTPPPIGSSVKINRSAGAGLTGQLSRVVSDPLPPTDYIFGDF
jgi:hypothetical protein